MAQTSLTVLVTPSEIAGQWVAHVLNIDLVTQGDSIQHAFTMAREAVRMVVADDIIGGHDPLDRPRASESCWSLVAQIARDGQPLATVEDKSRVKAAVAQLLVTVPEEHLPEPSRPVDVEMLPPVWQMAALNELRNSRHCH